MTSLIEPLLMPVVLGAVIAVLVLAMYLPVFQMGVCGWAMTPNLALQRDAGQRLLIESSRVSLDLIILGVSIISYLFSNQFLNWHVLAPFYGLISLALLRI